jgi:hypothetical protein
VSYGRTDRIVLAKSTQIETMYSVKEFYDYPVTPNYLASVRQAGEPSGDDTEAPKQTLNSHPFSGSLAEV